MTARQTPDAARVELTNDIQYLARTLVLDCQDIQQLRRVQAYLARAVQAVQEGVRTPSDALKADYGVATCENESGVPCRRYAGF